MIRKMLAMVFAGYRTEAIRILGKEVLLPGGLTGLAVDTIDHAGNEIRQVSRGWTSSQAELPLT